MRRYVAMLRSVYGDPFNVATAVVTTGAALALLAWAGQVVSRFSVGGIYWDLEPSRVAVIVALAASVGAAVPLTVESWRRSRQARHSAAVVRRNGAGILAGVVGGIACVSCCSPLLLPALGGLVGASGTTLLSANLALHRWFVPIALVSLAVVNGSSAIALRDLVRGCRVPAPEAVFSADPVRPAG